MGEGPAETCRCRGGLDRPSEAKGGSPIYRPRPRRDELWKRPLMLLLGGIGVVLSFLVLSKILFVLFYLTGGLLLVAIILWLLWRWWW